MNEATRGLSQASCAKEEPEFSTGPEMVLPASCGALDSPPGSKDRRTSREVPQCG